MPQVGQNQTDSVHIRPPHWLLFIYVPPTLTPWPSISHVVFAYCKLPKTGDGKGLGVK